MQHLKDRSYYEEIYDRATVKWGRWNTKYFNEMYDKFFEIMPDEPRNSHRAVLHLNLIYMVFVGNELIDRYDNREHKIGIMMAEDEAKDKLVTEARLISEPACRHCQSIGLRLIDKILCYRDSFDEPEEVLFILDCLKCHKRTSVWSDGTPMAPKVTECPKCNATMDEQSHRKGKVITTTYTCRVCNHQFKEKLDLAPKEKEVDPDFATDRPLYCLHDEKILKEFRDAKWRYEEMARLGKEMKEKEENKHIYDAIAEIKKPKIGELATILRPLLEKEGYSEFGLEKPDVGRFVYVSFSCLDNKSNRQDHESRKVLQKTIRTALEDTSWRLTNDGITYRLGYLSGTLRAYEQEEDLKKLVIKRGGAKSISHGNAEKDGYRIRSVDGKDIIL